MKDSPTPARWTPAVWLATGLGVSRGVPAPGTVGALWGIPLYLAIRQLPGQAWQIVAIAAVVGLGVPICARAAADLVRLGEASDAKDPPSITWDEFATVPIVYACLPASMLSTTWLVVGFALHRLFDITKPWPCRRLERLPGGWGIMADDVAASVYAGATLWLVSRYVGG